MSEAASSAPKPRAAKLELDYVSWWGDCSFGLSVVALVFTILSVATPSWVVQNFTAVDLVSPQGTNYSGAASVGRGLFQSYFYQDHTISLYTIYTDDADGNAWDPFCGNLTAPPMFPLVTNNNQSAPFHGRFYDSANFCVRRKTTAGVAILTIVFGFLALAATCGAQKGCCGQMPFIICAAAMVITCMVVCSNMGRFILKERKLIEETPIDQRFFPFETVTNPGYGLILFACCILLYIVTILLAGCEMCCGRSEDDKFDNDRDVEMVKAQTT
eukprot:m.302687 g.302687  ORF g.302687 m.302687 type:complete len:272 (+) comp15886_c2_seq1:239-1054(+)